MWLIQHVHNNSIIIPISVGSCPQYDNNVDLYNAHIIMTCCKLFVIRQIWLTLCVRFSTQSDHPHAIVIHLYLHMHVQFLSCLLNY